MENNTEYYIKEYTISKELEICLMVIFIIVFCCLSTFIMAVIDRNCDSKYGVRNVYKRKGLCYHLKKSKKRKYQKNDKVLPENISI
tara:strand:- start:111 stop:368 length:258 start_codon:yes stop_codon:yes gene_type:complete